MKFKVGDVVYRDTEFGIDIMQVIEVNHEYILKQVNQYNLCKPGRIYEISFNTVDRACDLLDDEAKAREI